MNIKIDNEYNYLIGNLNRLCVTKDKNEATEHLKWVIKRAIEIHNLKINMKAYGDE